MSSTSTTPVYDMVNAAMKSGDLDEFNRLIDDESFDINERRNGWPLRWNVLMCCLDVKDEKAAEGAKHVARADTCLAILHAMVECERFHINAMCVLGDTIVEHIRRLISTYYHTNQRATCQLITLFHMVLSHPKFDINTVGWDGTTFFYRGGSSLYCLPLLEPFADTLDLNIRPANETFAASVAFMPLCQAVDLKLDGIIDALLSNKSLLINEVRMGKYDHVISTLLNLSFNARLWALDVYRVVTTDARFEMETMARFPIRLQQTCVGETQAVVLQKLCEEEMIDVHRLYVC